MATEGREIIVPIGFPLPVAIDPPPAPPSPHVLVNPTWLERPGVQDFARYYPRDAYASGLEGRATLDCLVATGGLLVCTVVSESPEGAHFGDAAIRLSRHFRIAPTTTDGTPTTGGRVRVPISFRLS